MESKSNGNLWSYSNMDSHQYPMAWTNDGDVRYEQVNSDFILGDKMKAFLKIFLSSIASTILVVVFIFLIGKLFVPEIGLHITYPIRVLRGTEIYEGETRGAEVFLVWERFILPFIFFTSMTVFVLFRKKLFNRTPQ